MQELVGRLSALDPEASETLKVVSYFDALVAGGVGVDGLLRGAAALAGAVVGVELHGRVRRRDPLGAVPPATETRERMPRRALPGGVAWIERGGQPHANDEMVVERLALAIELTEARRSPEGALEIALDAARPIDERSSALARLRVTPDARVRIVAVPAEPVPEGPSAVVPTRFGIVRALLDDGDRQHPSPAGLGSWTRADHLPESWDAALVALRLVDAQHPVVDAAELGSLVLLARRAPGEDPPADVRALAALDARSRQVLRALVEADSVRAAAAALGMHHSTLQARHESLTHELGYDPRSALGRARAVAADLLLRLSD